MALTVNINLDVPDLEDNGVAFANNAAWKNYWSNINLTATFDPAVNDLYNEVPINGALTYTEFELEGNVYDVVGKLQFDNLLAAYAALNNSYKNLRDVLKAAGLITESQ